MQLNKRWLVVFLIITGLLAACQEDSETPQRIDPALAAQQHPDSTRYRLRLTERVAEQLNLKTAQVREERVKRSGTLRKVIPKPAAISDPEGNTWIYTIPSPLVYVRQRIKIDYTEGDLAVLMEGPPVGATIVTEGAEQLLLREIGIAP